MANENKEQGAQGRFGYVSDYDPARHMARIKFPDKGDLVSGWIPVSVSNSKKNRDEVHLDIGEHVYCNMMGNGLEMGVVLCSLYDDTNKPPAGDADIRKTTYDDGTEIIYDRKNHKLQINCVGDIEIHADGNIKITGSRIDLN
ncbi:MAG: phage baseplate assembly protein V [Synergistaceae bacterium]|nr:phage baseplate assembly protein V [Synergistaceae bacterium]